MACKIIQTIWSWYNSGISRTEVRAVLECDTASDLPATVDSLSGYRLTIGTRAHVIDTNAEYMLDSSGSWYLQDGAGYYTSTQVDQMFTGIIPSVFGYNEDYMLTVDDDLNDILIPGNFTAPSNAVAAAVLNSPWTSTRYKFINAVITGSTPSNLRAAQFVLPNLYANQTPLIFIRYRHNLTFTPWHQIVATTI